MAFNGGATAPIKPIRSTRPKQMNSFAFKGGGAGSAITKAVRPRFKIGGGVGTGMRPLPNGGSNGGSNGGAAPFVVPRQAQPKQAQPAAPVAPQTPAAPQPPRPPSYLDAQYFTNLAQARFQADQDIAGYNQQSAYERAALSEAMRRLAGQQQQGEQSTTSSGNAAGLLYGGALGRQLGDLRTDFLRQRTDAQSGFDQAEAARRAQIESIRGGLTFLEQQEQLAAIERQAAADMESPLVEPDVPELAQPAVAAAKKKRSLPAKNRTAANRAAAREAVARARAQAQQQKAQQAKKGKR